MNPAGEPLRFGPWTVVGELGRGGMGRVLLVERSSPPQQAALKILPAAAHGPEERRRFRREQALLARLEHPNVARFLDAGETPEGDLYLVLEKVEGVPIDEYCAGLPLRARVEVFRDLCRAVAAAHQHLIVHCDLKPSNVLVRADGTVKLLDFGVARLADNKLATATLESSFSTWSYASPEQLVGARLSAASDVYSLGVLLFEILTGRKPFGDLGRAWLAQVEARRDPPRASTALPPGASAALRRGLRQDLDFVIGRALRPEPERRYAGIDELIADLEAWLEGAPVAARRDDRGYVLRRFLRRHGVAIAAGGLFLLLLSGATLALGLQARRVAAGRDLARQQEKVAGGVADFFLDLIESRDGPGAEPGLIRSLADRAMERLDREHALEDARLVRAQVMLILSTHFRLVGNNAWSERLARGAQQIWREDLGPENEEAVVALEALTIVALDQGDLGLACGLAREALQLAQKLGEVESRIFGLSAAGNCAGEEGRFEDADRLLSEAERLSAATHGFASRDHEIRLMNVLYAKQMLGKDAELVEILRQVVRERRARRPWLNDFYLLARIHQLAGLLVARGALDEAEAELVTAMKEIEPHETRLGAPVYMSRWGVHPAQLELQLADIRRRRGHPEEALALASRAAERLRADLPPDSPRHLQARRVRALALADLGAYAEAVPALAAVRAELADQPGDPGAALAEVDAALARATAARGKGTAAGRR